MIKKLPETVNNEARPFYEAVWAIRAVQVNVRTVAEVFRGKVND